MKIKAGAMTVAAVLSVGTGLVAGSGVAAAAPAVRPIITELRLIPNIVPGTGGNFSAVVHAPGAKRIFIFTTYYPATKSSPFYYCGPRDGVGYKSPHGVSRCNFTLPANPTTGALKWLVGAQATSPGGKSKYAAKLVVQEAP